MEEELGMFLFAEDLDKRMGWKPGRAERLARQRRLPHVLLPDGSVRFVWDEIQALIVSVPVVPPSKTVGRRDD
jgi:hypothetical protein